MNKKRLLLCISSRRDRYWFFKVRKIKDNPTSENRYTVLGNRIYINSNATYLKAISYEKDGYLLIRRQDPLDLQKLYYYSDLE